MKHPENTRVFDYSSPDLLLLDTFRIENNNVFCITERKNEKEINTYQELVNYINNRTLESMETQGFVIFSSDNPTVKQELISLYIIRFLNYMVTNHQDI